MSLAEDDACLRLPAADFATRFQHQSGVEDPYTRYYDICSDASHPGHRVAVRRYIADDDQKQQDVLESNSSST